MDVCLLQNQYMTKKKGLKAKAEYTVNHPSFIYNQHATKQHILKQMLPFFNATAARV